MNAPLTYVYCLVSSARRPALRGVPPGVPDAEPPRALDAGRGLWAIVATVPGEEYGERAISAGLQDLDWVGARAVAHEAVVEHFLAAAGVLPMQLFALFVSDERALEHVARDRRRIDGIFARIAGRLEWGLRLTFDEKAARDAVRGRQGSNDASGAGYLQRKRDLLDVSRVQLAEAQAEANRLYRALAQEAADARRRRATEQAAPGSRLLLDAAFLVPARRSGAFRTALRRNARDLRAAGLVVTLTGPWPPYNFIAPAAPARRRTAKTPSRRAAASRSPGSRQAGKTNSGEASRAAARSKRR